MANYPHAIPTPPFSPTADAIVPQPPETPLRSTANLLESLVSFYQQERMWVYRTRAELEEALQNTQPSDCSTVSQLDNSTIHTLPSPSLSTIASTLENGVPADTILVKAESSSDISRPSSPIPSNTRWNRRKRAFKLRLDNLAPKPRRTPAPPRPSDEPSVRILEMYESMMSARMESCQRINRMIRNANRADLHIR
ncbi:hypothetical protein ONZ45_g131 [Pleurotus djamor]|nr:hypothetical protein ONZ45_g131 [Pleurotus djamor]